MTRAISASEAKNRFGALLDAVAARGDEVIVERQGRPQAAIISFAEYEDLQRLREGQRRREALTALRRLRAEIRARNEDLTDADAEALADRATRDAISALVERGSIRFER